jgi:hypothetical protein
MIEWLLFLFAALWVGSRIARLIGFRATVTILWAGLVAFTVGIAYELYAETGDICGIIAAITFLAFVAYFIRGVSRPQGDRTDF